MAHEPSSYDKVSESGMNRPPVYSSNSLLLNNHNTMQVSKNYQQFRRLEMMLRLQLTSSEGQLSVDLRKFPKRRILGERTRVALSAKLERQREFKFS